MVGAVIASPALAIDEAAGCLGDLISIHRLFKYLIHPQGIEIVEPFRLGWFHQADYTQTGRSMLYSLQKAKRAALMHTPGYNHQNYDVFLGKNISQPRRMAYFLHQHAPRTQGSQNPGSSLCIIVGDQNFVI